MNIQKAQDILLQLAVWKQAVEPLRGSKLFGIWARDWIKSFDEAIWLCIDYIREERNKPITINVYIDGAKIAETLGFVSEKEKEDENK